MQETPENVEWMSRARCRGTDPDTYFPSGSLGVDAALRVCKECPVRTECVEYAMAHKIYIGIWGGLSERQRRRLRRQRRATAAQSAQSEKPELDPVAVRDLHESQLVVGG